MIKEEEKIELRSEEFQEILGAVPHWILRWGITVLAFVIIILLIGSAIIKYPDVLSSQVELTGSMPPASVVSRTSGKLRELYVKDNQTVKDGEYLAVIDNPANTEDILFLKNYLDSLALFKPTKGGEQLLPFEELGKDLSFRGIKGGLQVGSLQSLYASLHAVLFDYMEYKRLSYYPQKTVLAEERIVRYEEQYAILQNQQRLTEEQFTLVQSQFRRDSSMFIRGGISVKELENSKSVYLQSLMSIENMRSTLGNMRIQIAQLKESLFDMHQQDTEKGNDLRSRIRSLTTQLEAEIQSWELNYVLQSPVVGTITFTGYWVENQNVQAGATVFTVVPGGSYEIVGKAMLPIARSGKVEIGQKVNIRLQNFPENEYGVLRGIVSNISLVPAQTGEMAYYMVEINLPDRLLTTYKKELPWLPNMQGQADIITEDISLLERFILPIKKILTESI